MKKNIRLIPQWKAERDKVVLSGDLEAFKEFYRKWQALGFYDDDLPSDEILTVSMYKMLCMMENAPEDKKEAAAIWLKDHKWSV